MKYKSALLLVAAVLVLGIGYFVSTLLFGSNHVSEAVDKVETNSDNGSVPTYTAVEEGEDSVASEVENEFPLNMREAKICEAIHSMSHAKVYAEEKWSHLEPTQERINRLLLVVEQNRARLSNSDLYINILKRWQSGDFSKAVSDHNQIWSLLGGNIGKATRLLTQEEEEEYRKQHF